METGLLHDYLRNFSMPGKKYYFRVEERTQTRNEHGNEHCGEGYSQPDGRGRLGDG